MKNVLIALVLLLTVTSCLPEKNKNKDPEPELAGTYQVNRLVSGGQTYTLPSGGSSAVAFVTSRSDSQIDVRVDVVENGSTTPVNFGTLGIRKASGRDYDVLNPNTNARIGSINGTDFTLDFFGNNGQRFALNARK